MATVSAVTTVQTATLTAHLGSVSKSFCVTLNPTAAATPTLSISTGNLAFGSLAVNTATTQSVTLTSSGTGAVTVSAATLTGAGFTMSGASFPLTLNPGQTATLNVQFDPTVAGAATGQLTISSNSSTNGTAVIGLSGTGVAVLSTLTCGSATMAGAGSDGCTVSLNAAAPSGGLIVGISSNNAAVTVPATVTVPAGATSAGFTATVSSVSSTQSVTLTATAGGVSKSFALQLNTSVPTLSVSTTSLAFGNVTVNVPATQSVSLTSTGTAAVTVSSATLTGSGFTISGMTFPVTLNPGQTATLTLQFDPTVTGTVTGQLTITSNSSTNGTVVIGLSGTGQSASHQVNLVWDAPAGSLDPVAGYHIYRSADGGGTYQEVNTSMNTLTSFADATVQSGLTYDYVVKSVDASGVESTPSNMTVAIVP